MTHGVSTHLIGRWLTVLGWGAVMLIVWARFVPDPLPFTTFVLLGFAGFLVSIAGTALWISSRPSPSIAQIPGTTEADRSTATVPAP
jgi:hypothetical protein